MLNITLRAQPILDEQRAADRIYLPQVGDRDGAPGPYGLTQYTFKPNSSYRDEELFVGQSAKGRWCSAAPSRCRTTWRRRACATCRWGPGLALYYRFKRTQLADWRDIDAGVRALIASFMDTHA